MGHHANSPSNFHRRMACPGSRAAEDGLPDTSSEYAEEGTAAHELAYLALRAGEPAAQFIGQTLNGFEVTAEMAEAVQQYMDNVLMSCNVHAYEVKVDLSEWVSNGGSGTADHVGVDADGRLYVDDYKHGKGVAVYAENNPQIALYALGSLEVGDMLSDVPLKDVALRIHQPRINNSSEEIITVAELLRRGEEYEAADAATYAPDAPRIPGEEQCKFCKAKAYPDRCPELPQAIKALAKGGVPEDVDALAKAKSMTKLAADWASAVDTRALALARDGVAIPGWKLVRGRRGSRTWDDPEAAAAEGKRARIKKDVLYPPKLASPTQLEKAIGLKFARFKPFVVQPPGSLSLAPAADKRAAVTPNDDVEFDAINEEDEI